MIILLAGHLRQAFWTITNTFPGQMGPSAPGGTRAGPLMIFWPGEGRGRPVIIATSPPDNPSWRRSFPNAAVRLALANSSNRSVHRRLLPGRAFRYVRAPGQGMSARPGKVPRRRIRAAYRQGPTGSAGLLNKRPQSANTV